MCIAPVEYSGFYPLGGEAEINGIRIMQEEWREYKGLVFIVGRKHVVSPCGEYLFYVEKNGKTVFFTAQEYGIAKYHIFTVSEKASERLLKRLTKNKNK